MHLSEDPRYSINPWKMACAIPRKKHSHFLGANRKTKQGETINEQLMFSPRFHWLQMKGFEGILQKLDSGFAPKMFNSLAIKNSQETPEISLGFAQPAFEDFLSA